MKRKYAQGEMLDRSLFRRETKFVVAFAFVVPNLIACQIRRSESEVLYPTSVEVAAKQGETEKRSNSVELDLLADQLRQLYFSHEYPACVETGRELGQWAKYTESSRALGWWYLCRNQIEPVARVVAEAKNQTRSRVEAHVHSPGGDASRGGYDEREIKRWSNFVQVAAWLGDRRYLSQVQLQLQSLAMNALYHPDLEWVYAYALSQLYAVEEAMPKVEAIVESALAGERETAQLLVILAKMKTFQFVVEPQNEEARKRSIELYERAVEINPQLLDAYLEPREAYYYLKHETFRNDWLEKAEAVAPESLVLKVSRWNDLLKRSKLAQDPNIAKLVGEIEQYLANIENSNTESFSKARRGAERRRALFAVAKIYRNLGREKERDRLYNIILEQFPHSREAEHIALSKTSSSEILEQELPDSTKLKKRESSKEGLPIHHEQMDRTVAYQKKLREFIDRPVHYDRDSLAYVYAKLLLSYGKGELADAVEPAYLLDLARHAVKNQGTLHRNLVFGEVPIFLAEHTPFQIEARSIAEQGLQHAPEYQMTIGSNFYRTSDVDDRLRVFRSAMHDAIGWSYVREGRLEQAHASIDRALQIYPPFPQAIVHMAKVEEMQGLTKEAEKRLIQCIEAGIMGAEHFCKHALKRMVVSRKGGLDGFERYFRKARAQLRRQKKRDVLASKKTKRETIPALELADMQGQPFAYPSLSGKITVVHFWGMW